MVVCLGILEEYLEPLQFLPVFCSFAKVSCNRLTVFGLHSRSAIYDRGELGLEQ
jgi:hypothetical protein